MAPAKPTGAIVAAAAISIAIASYFYLCKSNKKTKLPLSFNSKKKKKLKRNGLVDTIGNTPLIRINSLSEATGCEVSVDFCSLSLFKLRFCFLGMARNHFFLMYNL